MTVLAVMRLFLQALLISIHRRTTYADLLLLSVPSIACCFVIMALWSVSENYGSDESRSTGDKGLSAMSYSLPVGVAGIVYCLVLLARNTNWKLARWVRRVITGLSLINVEDSVTTPGPASA